MKDYFPKPLLGEFIGKDQWRLTAEFWYDSDKYGVVKIPIDFVVNGASIPRWAQFIIGSPWGGRYAEPSAYHDWAYSQNLYSRRECDKEFLIAMYHHKVPTWKCNIMYLALRIGGWWSWKRKA